MIIYLRKEDHEYICCQMPFFQPCICTQLDQGMQSEWTIWVAVLLFVRKPDTSLGNRNDVAVTRIWNHNDHNATKWLTARKTADRLGRSRKVLDLPQRSQITMKPRETGPRLRYGLQPRTPYEYSSVRGAGNNNRLTTNRAPDR